MRSLAESFYSFYNSTWERFPIALPDGSLLLHCGAGRRKHMKFSNLGRASLAAVASLGVAAGMSACGGPNGTNSTIDYVFVTNSKGAPGQINAYFADSKSGALSQVSNSPFDSGGNDPVGLVTSPDFQSLYVVNRESNSIVQFSIGNNAQLAKKNSYTTPGSSPNAIAINSTGTLLFVTDTLAPGATTGSGVLVVYPIGSDGSLGSPVANGALSYFPLATGTDVLTPTAVNVLTQNPINATTTGPTFVYVVNNNITTGLGSISSFAVGANGALTYVPCSSSASICDTTGNGTYNAGTAPNAIASTPRGLFLYVTDSVNNQLISYTVQSSGQIIPSQNGPTRTDLFPDSITVDPRGLYIYVANYNAKDVSAYTINTATGYPTGTSAAASYGVGTGPTCVFVEPAIGRYVYTTNFLDNTVSGFSLDPNTGTLTGTQSTPYPATGAPTCIAATPHGNHAISAPQT
jgi:6-phosphogluconolactonase